MNYYEILDKVYIFVEKDITFKMRSLLNDWMISCQRKLALNDDTLFLSIFI